MPVAACAGRNTVLFFSHPERLLNETEEASYQALLQRRLGGEPVAYILGEREFFGLNLSVNTATLIPQPDTELLVELVLERISQNGMRVLDMGTGSGVAGGSRQRTTARPTPSASYREQLVLGFE